MIGPTVTVEIQSVTNTSNSLGGFTETWALLGYFDGILIAADGKEILTSGKKTVISTHTFYSDYQEDITVTSTCRLIYGTRTFDILFVNNLAEMGRYLILDLMEIV
jgi:head-tail adaptor